jgi:hypothetical protein
MAKLTEEHAVRASSPGAQADRPYRGDMLAHEFDLAMLGWR